MARFRYVFVLYMAALLMIDSSMATTRQAPRGRFGVIPSKSSRPLQGRSVIMVKLLRKANVYHEARNKPYHVQGKLTSPVVVVGCGTSGSGVSHTSTTLLLLHTLRGGGGGQVLDIDELVGDAYDWCNNLGAPAALVAGAVLATLYEHFRGGQLELHQGDTTYIKVAKKVTNMLLLSAFAMQIVSIFVTTVMGSVLRSYDYSNTKSTATSGLAFLQEQYEFEFLTSRLSFLQGLLHWLAGVAIEYTIPRKGEGQAAKKMDHFIAISLATLIVLLLSFYNSHLSFYPNYFQMLLRWVHVTAIKYFETYQPLMILYIPGILLSVYAGFEALREGAYSEERDD